MPTDDFHRTYREHIDPLFTRLIEHMLTLGGTCYFDAVERPEGHLLTLTVTKRF